MAAEVFAGLGALKTAFDLAKGLKDINDAAIRNAAIIELQERILSAQQAQSTLIETIRELETEKACFETWEAEKQRYKLIDYGGGTFAYELKSEAAGGEPAHRLCPACYEKRQKSILQFQFKNAMQQDVYKCPGCDSKFEFGHRQTPSPRTSRSWVDSRR